MIVFVPKTHATTWRLASKSKDLHSLPDAVLNVTHVGGVRELRRTVKLAWVQFCTEKEAYVYSFPRPFDLLMNFLPCEWASPVDLLLK